jgi:hypothetical protein
MAGMPKHYPVEQRERAVKMVLDHLQEYRSVYVACQSMGPNVGVGTGPSLVGGEDFVGAAWVEIGWCDRRIAPAGGGSVLRSDLRVEGIRARHGLIRRLG